MGHDKDLASGGREGGRCLADSTSLLYVQRQTPKGHLSNRERKEAAKALRKQAARETRKKSKQIKEETGSTDSDPVGATAI